MQDKYIGLSGDYVLDHVTGERMPKEEYDALEVERAAALAALDALAAVAAIKPATVGETAPITVKKGATNGTI